MHTNSTLRNALSDRLWEQDQARQSSYIAAEEAAREKARVLALNIEAVNGRYSFAPNYDEFRVTANGDCIQAAMTLTEGTDRLTVVAQMKEDGSDIWFIQDATRLRFDAHVYIQAVKNRIEKNKARKN